MTASTEEVPTLTGEALRAAIRRTITRLERGELSKEDVQRLQDALQARLGRGIGGQQPMAMQARAPLARFSGAGALASEQSAAEKIAEAIREQASTPQSAFLRNLGFELSRELSSTRGDDPESLDSIPELLNQYQQLKELGQVTVTPKRYVELALRERDRQRGIERE